MKERLFAILTVLALLPGLTGCTRGMRIKGLTREGEQAQEHEKWDEALECWNSVLNLDPQDAYAYASRGYVHEMKSEWTMSIADYTDAIHNQSDYAYAYARRGSVQNILGNFTAALRDLNEALRLEPHDTGALVDRGYAHDLSGDVSNAIADFDKAVALEPKESHAYAFRGYAWFRSGDFEAAIRDLDHATQLEPDDPEAWNLLAWFRATCASEKFRDGSEALTAATKACELSHWKEPCYIDTLAAAHAENGIFELAVKCEQQALSCHPPCKALSREMQERLTLYEQHQPYREASKQSQRPTTPILP